MAELMRCKVCDDKISSDAPTCLSCGARWPQPGLLGETRRLVAEGKPVQAMKAVRKKKGLSPQEAMAWLKEHCPAR